MFLGVESVAEDCARGTCQARTSYTVLWTEVLLEQELLGTPLSSGRIGYGILAVRAVSGGESKA